MKKIAVISTSQAQPCWYAMPGWKNLEDEHKRTGAQCAEVSPFFQALLLGEYDIVVFTTRASGSLDGPWDAWKNHVRLCDVFTATQADPCGPEHRTAGCKCYREMLGRVYAHLGLDLPAEAATWMDLHHGLKRHGVVTSESDLLERVKAGTA